jgi:hypothetical protein
MRVSALLSMLLVGSLNAGGLAGQLDRPLGPPSAAFGPGSLGANTSTAAGTTWKHRLLTGLGSAALGSGVGFFVSQLNRSDWDEIPGQSQSNRGLWAALGGGLGFAVGFSFPVTGRGPSGNPPATLSDRRSVITLAEIRGLAADNAYDIVRLLRPEWLNARPPTVFGKVKMETVPVYLDDFRYGEVDSMRGIHVQTIFSIRSIPPSVATSRWGTGHAAGVIQIITIGDVESRGEEPPPPVRTGR